MVYSPHDYTVQLNGETLHAVPEEEISFTHPAEIETIVVTGEVDLYHHTITKHGYNVTFSTYNPLPEGVDLGDISMTINGVDILCDTDILENIVRKIGG